MSIVLKMVLLYLELQEKKDWKKVKLAILKEEGNVDLNQI